MRAAVMPCHRIVSSGGFAKDPVRFGAAIDALGRPVSLPDNGQVTIMGTAAAAGPFPHLAAAAVARTGRTVEPDRTAPSLLVPTTRGRTAHPESHADVG